jgi:hypothetical protein
MAGKQEVRRGNKEYGEETRSMAGKQEVWRGNKEYGGKTRSMVSRCVAGDVVEGRGRKKNDVIDKVANGH